MKKLFVLALVLIGTTLLAQEGERKQHEHKMEQFTPEQQSQLLVKKMTLELDLTENQQKEIRTFVADKMAKKEAFITKKKEMKEKGVKPTADERFEMHIQLLDEQIASKKTMQQILNAKQFEKWASLKKENTAKRTHQHQRKLYEKRHG